MTDEVRYLHLLPGEFTARLAARPVAYLPLGTLEWHGPHLPLGSDAIQAEEFFLRLARRAGGIVLPPLTLGPDLHEVHDGNDYYGMDIVGFTPGTPCRLEGSAYWVEDHLFGEMLSALFHQLSRVGFRVVVAHGHGPSTRYVMTHHDQLGPAHGLRVLHCWRDHEDDDEGIMNDHAAFNETSLMSLFRPLLVRIDRIEDADGFPPGTMGRRPPVAADKAFAERIVATHLERMCVQIDAALDARLR